MLNFEVEDMERRIEESDRRDEMISTSERVYAKKLQDEFDMLDYTNKVLGDMGKAQSK